MLTEEQEVILGNIEEYINKSIQEETRVLNDIIKTVNSSLFATHDDGHLRFDMTLHTEELEFLCVKIPAECMCLQSRLNQYSAKGVAQSLKKDFKLTIAQLSLADAKGTVSDKKNMAESHVLYEKVQNSASKAIVKGIQDTIERGDKLYEGIKKVMDFRAKEGWYDRKQQG